MANINDVYIFITNVLERKSLLGFNTADEVNKSLDRAVKEEFNMYVREYGKTQQIHDAISVFKKQANFTDADTPSGVLTLAADMVILLNTYTVVYNNTTQKPEKKVVTFVNEDQLISAINSQVRPCSASRRVAIQVGSTLVLYPESPCSGTYTYLRAPVSPVWAYSQSGRTITYDPVNSVEIEFNQVYWSNIIMKALSYLGVNLSEGELVNFAQTKGAETA